LIRYILTFFLLAFALNALEVEIIDSFGYEQESKVINIDNFNTNKSTKKPKPNSIKAALKKPNTKESNKTAKVIKKTLKKPTKHTIVKSKKNKPQLAIIIDDITTKSQIRFLKSLPYHITPSIFPPTKMNMHSHYLARNLKHFMVHLPLESHSRAMNKINKMLFLRDSNAKIRARVKEIRKLFPNAKYLNNHTGSVFSKNYLKCKVLYKALMKNGFIFLDSRTAQKTKFGKIAREFGKKYYKSDVFIDNKLSINYTLSQLKKGIALAKKRGYAVVIGHPHPTTFKALKKATKLFKNINMVYIDELRF